MASLLAIVIFAIVAVAVLCWIFSPPPSALMISQTSSKPMLKSYPTYKSYRSNGMYGIGSGYCCPPATYCGGGGLTMPEVVEGENGLWRFQVYTVQPGAVNNKYLAVQMG